MQHIVDRLVIVPLGFFFARSELAEDDAGDVVELAGQAERAEHAVDAVGRFADVFEEQNLAVGFDFVRRAHHGVQDGEVAADESAAGFAGVQGDGAGDVFEECGVVGRVRRWGG